jgi:hypothetical protein
VEGHRNGGFGKLRLDSLLPKVQVLHPYPDARFVAKHPHIRGTNRVR